MSIKNSLENKRLRREAKNSGKLEGYPEFYTVQTTKGKYTKLVCSDKKPTMPMFTMATMFYGNILERLGVKL